MPAETESLTTQQKPDEKNANGHIKAAKRAYANQNKKPLDENQIAQYLPLVHKIARRAATYLRPPLTYDDLVSAGKDGKFTAASASIEGNTVVVSSPDVPAPVAVRLGWDQTADPNLVNREGLPASSFRTDR